MLEELAKFGAKAVEGQSSTFEIPAEQLLEVARFAATKKINTVIIDPSSSNVTVTFVTTYESPDVESAKDFVLQCCF
ncbi:MAG: hypothetical protein F6J92_21925 [Symploca sp. SIO1A3]|nr:hypothetical protein [Symploca sp. SIO1A3]